MDGNPTLQEGLPAVLRAIRRESRMTQKVLWQLSGVGTTTIKSIESGEQRSKPETLRLLADAAATDGVGQCDPSKAADYYRRLMVASGYAPEAASPTDSFDWRTAYRQGLESLFGTDDADFVEQVLSEMAKLGQRERQFIFRLMRGGIPNLISAHSNHERAVQPSFP